MHMTHRHPLAALERQPHGEDRKIIKSFKLPPRIVRWIEEGARAEHMTQAAFLVREIDKAGLPASRPDEPPICPKG